MYTAGQVFTQIRSLVDDDLGDFTTNDYLVPKLQIALDWLVVRLLNNPNMGSLKTEVILPSVPTGTRSLSSYFVTGGPLATLTEVISIKERPSGGTRTEMDWVEMDEVPNLPATLATSFNRVYVWTLDDIKLLGADQATDLRIFGKFTSQAIKDPTTPIPPNVGVILAYKAASVISKPRGNMVLGNDYAKEADNLVDSLFCTTIMNQQGMSVRMRPFSSWGPRYT